MDLHLIGEPASGLAVPVQTVKWLNSINRQVQDRQFTDYPLSVVTPSWRSEPEVTWQLISPILNLYLLTGPNCCWLTSIYYPEEAPYFFG